MKNLLSRFLSSKKSDINDNPNPAGISTLKVDEHDRFKHYYIVGGIGSAKSRASMEHENKVYMTTISKRLLNLQSLFVDIRRAKEGLQLYIPILKSLVNSLDEIILPTLESNGLEILEKPIISTGRHTSLKDIPEFIEPLKCCCAQLISCIESQDSKRVFHLADAIHNIPEFLTCDSWDPKDFWQMYIEPYQKKYDGTFLSKWKYLFE